MCSSDLRARLATDLPQFSALDIANPQPTDRLILRNMPDPIPAVLIGRLAVDLRYQGRKIGASLLQDALYRIITASQSIGVAYILVHALDDGAKRFYEVNGFVAIPERPLTLFLPVATALIAMKSLIS